MLLTAAYLFQYTWSLMGYQWHYKVRGHAGKRQKKKRYFQRKTIYSVHSRKTHVPVHAQCTHGLSVFFWFLPCLRSFLSLAFSSCLADKINSLHAQSCSWCLFCFLHLVNLHIFKILYFEGHLAQLAKMPLTHCTRWLSCYESCANSFSNSITMEHLVLIVRLSFFLNLTSG